MIHQWRRINRIPGELLNEGMILVSKDRFDALLQRFDRLFNSLVLECVAVLFALPAGIVVVQTARETGIYGWLLASGDAVPLVHLGGWWANPEIHPAAYLVQILCYSAYLYLLFHHTLMGVIAVWIVLSVRRLAEHREQWLAFPSIWVYDSPSIRDLRAAVNDVAISITLMVLTLLVGNFYIRFPRLLEVFFIVPYVLLNPLFIVVPAYELNRQIETSRREIADRSLQAWRVAPEPPEPSNDGSRHRAYVTLDGTA